MTFWSLWLLAFAQGTAFVAAGLVVGAALLCAWSERLSVSMVRQARFSWRRVFSGWRRTLLRWSVRLRARLGFSLVARVRVP